jgi:hypothetical protein
MKFAPFLFAPVLFALAGALAAAESSLEREVVAMERQFFTAWQNKSTDAVEKNIAPEGISWSEWGVMDKAAQIANQKNANANCAVRSFSFENVRVIPVSRDSAMLLYTVNQDALCGTSPAPTPVSNSSLWVKRDGRWVNVYRASVFPRKP